MNKHLISLFISLFIINISCTKPTKHKMILPEYQDMIDSSKVSGSILIYDNNSNVYYSNDFTWAETGKLPASTFKIPHSVIAIELGLINYESDTLFWDGSKRDMKIWEQDLSFKQAFQFSCVPCYKNIAKQIGYANMKKYLAKLEYENMVFDSTNITEFWLHGASKISQMQQIDFLQRLYFQKLKATSASMLTVKKMMLSDSSDNYSFYSKTGLSSSNNIYNGWIVGFCEKNNNIFFFAVNIEANKDYNFDNFINLRKKLAVNAIQIIENL